MCTAYKVGKRGNIPDEPLYEQVIDYFMGKPVPRIVRPTHKAPVILPDGSVREMTWGFRRRMKGKTGRPVARTIVNSREDKLAGPMWNEAFSERRCLVPAFSYFEWINHGLRNVPLEFESTADRMLWLAGIWEEDTERGPVFSMITTEPNGVVTPVHDRMPAVLAPDQIHPFLGGELREFGPSNMDLRFSEAGNFLKRKESEQGEMF